MGKPVVAIVGRPNVGKSTLFNRITGRRTAIVDDVAGLTRDRHVAEAVWDGRAFYVVDTGGFEDNPDSEIEAKVRAQAVTALAEADVVLFVMDGRQGLSSSDEGLFREIRRLGKPLIAIVNKVDGPRQEAEMYDFYRLGVDDLLPLSALNCIGYYEVMERLACELSGNTEDAEEDRDRVPKITVLGRPNVGKSTLVNALVGRERVIVSPVAGTTRDAIDTPCRYEGRPYLLIDTAGLRKKARIAGTVERYCVLRTIRSIDRSDVAILLIDAVEGVMDQDKKIAGLVHEAGKGLIVLLNKWDLTDRTEIRLNELLENVRTELWFAGYAPVISGSALTRQRIAKLYPIVDRIVEERNKRIPTGELNKALSEFIAAQAPPRYRRHSVKLLYMTQTGQAPPAFTVFVNYPEGVPDAYLRYLERSIRERFGFEGTPVRFFLRKRSSRRR